MRPPIPILGLIALLLCPASALGQSQRSNSWRLPWHESQASRSQNDALPSRMETRVYRQRPNVYGTARSLRFTTRTDRLRTELAKRFVAERNRRDRGLLFIERPPMSRAAQVLGGRNLLQSHSVLGRNRSALMGRQDYVINADGHWRGQVSLVESSALTHLSGNNAATKQRSYASQLSERLEEKADQYYKQGVAYFRDARYPRSRDYFLLVRQLENDRPRAFVAIVLVSLHEANINTAVTSLVHAIHRAESLDDLKVEWREFYAKEQDFRRVVNTVNVAAKSESGRDKAMTLMLAYYSFLNGDLNTAIAEAKAAEGQATDVGPASVGSGLNPGAQRKDPFTAAARRFGEFLVAARDQGGAPDDSK